VAGPLIRVPRPQPRVLELENEHSFAGVMQQSENVRRGPNATARVRVIVQVSDDDRRWADWEEFWSGAWRPEWLGGIPRPSTEDVVASAQASGCRYARYVIRSAI
jgi:hypothetical protein